MNELTKERLKEIEERCEAPVRREGYYLCHWEHRELIWFGGKIVETVRRWRPQEPK